MNYVSWIFVTLSLKTLPECETIIFRSVSCVSRLVYFFFSSRRRHTRFDCDWSSDVCSSDLPSGALSRRLFDGATHQYLLDYLLVRANAIWVVAGLVAVIVIFSVHRRFRLHRSEERRVGEEGRYRWAPGHYKKKKNEDSDQCS